MQAANEVIIYLRTIFLYASGTKFYYINSLKLCVLFKQKEWEQTLLIVVRILITKGTLL